MPVILGWIPREGAMASDMALFGPWPDASRGRPLCCLVLGGGFCGGAAWWLQSSPILNWGPLCHQVLVLGGAIHLIHLQETPHLGMERAQVAAILV